MVRSKRQTSTIYPITVLGKVKNLSELSQYNLADKYWVDLSGQVYVQTTSPPSDPKRLYVRMMSPDLKNGYLEYVLQNKEKKSIHVQAHRLCALAFVPNPDPDNLKEVNHIDGQRDNCYYKNLEWCNRSENVQHSWDNIRKRKKKK